MTEPNQVPSQGIPKTFMPHPDLCGFRPVDEVGKMRDLGDGPKRLYSLLVRRAGKRANCWPGFESLSEDLGKSVRQVKYDMKKLVDAGLILPTRRGVMRTNSYRFLLAPGLQPESEVQSIARHEVLGNLVATA